MDWYPNEDAVLHFLDAVLPADPARGAGRVAHRGRPEPERPAARPRRRRPASASPAPSTTCARYVAEAAVCVVPLRVGGGTRLKIFEALAMGKAVVSTPVGAEGLPLVPGEHYLCGRRAGRLRARRGRAAADPGGAAARGAGRDLVEERYSWATVARAFEGGSRRRWRGTAAPWPSSQIPVGAPVPRGDR